MPDEQDIPPAHRALCECPRDECGVRQRGYLRGARVRGLDCDRPLVLVMSCGHQWVKACGNHRESQCVPCSWKYRRRLVRIAESGCNRSDGYLYMLTLTAPGRDAHTMPSGEVCPCTPDGGVDLSLWNPSASARWNRLRTELRRQTPALQYLRAVEVQKRGALHLHVLVWSPVPLDKASLRRDAMHYGFGHSLDLAEVVPGSRQYAYYVSKYVTKACDQRDDVPWRADCLDEETGEVRSMRTIASYRTWSASREWGLTMRALKDLMREQARRRAAALAAGDSPTPADPWSDAPVAAGVDPPT